MVKTLIQPLVPVEKDQKRPRETSGVPAVRLLGRGRRTGCQSRCPTGRAATTWLQDAAAAGSTDEPAGNLTVEDNPRGTAGPR